MTPAEFKELLPEFGNETSNRIQAVINSQIPLLNKDRWGDLYNLGLANLVAHEMTLSASITGGQLAVMGGGEIISKTVGEVSYSKSQSLADKKADNPYLATIYGQRYWQYKGMLGPAIMAL